MAFGGDPNTTLEQLLADENILSEFKSLNPKLLDYCSDDKIKQLIKYIIEEPPADADKDRGYKFPFVACEILTADIESLMEAFFGRNPNHTRKQSTDSDYSGKADNKEDPDSSGERNIEIGGEEKEEQSKGEKEEDKKIEEKQTLQNEEKKEEVQEKEEKTTDQTQEPQKTISADIAHYFFSFLEGKDLNIVLVGYFARFLHSLIQRKSNEINDYVWQHPEVIDMLINQIEHRALAECLAKLFTVEISNSKADEFIGLKIEKLKKIVNIFESDSKSLSEEVVANIALVINEIITKKDTLPSKEQLDIYLASKEFIETLFNNMFKNKSLTTHVATIITTIIQQLLKGSNRDEDDDSQKEEIEKAPSKINQDNLHACLISKAGEIMEYLNEEHETQIDTTFGSKNAPLGFARLRLVELVFHIIRLGVHKINFEFALKGLFKVMMSLMVKFEWNNLLHNYIEKIFISTLESDSHVLREKLLHGADLLGFLSNSTQDVDYTFENPQHRKVRRGYLGHLTRIAKMIERLASADNDIKQYLDDERWNQFKEKYLQVTLDKDNTDLAKSVRKTSEDDFVQNIEEHDKKYGDFAREDHGKMEDLEDDINDREYDNAKGRDNFDDWNQNDTNEEGQKVEKGIDIWSMAPTDFGMTFKFTGFTELPKDLEPDKFLELNRKLEVIDIGPQHEPKLEQAYFDNTFWARPKNHNSHHIDDILKESES